MLWRPRSLRIRYTLRALLVFTMIVAIWCAFHANRGRYERAVEREFVALGGQVLSGTYDPTTGKTLEPGDYERLMMSVFGQRFIAAIQVSGETLPDARLPGGLVDRALALPHLESFAATRCQIQDDDLRNLSRATGLLSLSLPDNPVTDRGLAGLDRLILLKHLDLQGTAISDETLFRLPGLPQLVTVSLSRTSITGKGMPSFAATAPLHAFWAEKTMLCDDFLVAIAACNGLDSVLLEQCAFTDAGVKALDGHSSLKFVDLAGNAKLTDQSLDVLAGLPRLKRAPMSGTQITRAGVRAFRERRPDVDL